jgi:hypothetical protein
MKEEANYNMKQEILDEMERLETLEEAADMDSKNHYKDQSDYWAIGFDSFKRGAKWQAEKMYSEGEIHKIVESYQNTMENNPTYITYNQWFEQFKKK